MGRERRCPSVRPSVRQSERQLVHLSVTLSDCLIGLDLHVRLMHTAPGPVFVHVCVLNFAFCSSRRMSLIC